MGTCAGGSSRASPVRECGRTVGRALAEVPSTQLGASSPEGVGEKKKKMMNKKLMIMKKKKKRTNKNMENNINIDT